MAFDRKSIGEEDKVKPYLDGLEDRIASYAQNALNLREGVIQKYGQTTTSYEDLVRLGDLVVLNVAFYPSSGFAPDVVLTVGRLPYGFRPRQQFTRTVGVAQGNDVGGSVNINQEGEITITNRTTSNKKYIHFSVVFVTDND